FAPQLHESAGGLPKTKLVSHSCSLAGSTSAMEVLIPLHSCSLAGSTSAMKVSNWGGHLHFREVEKSDLVGSWQVMAGSGRVLAGIAGSVRYASTSHSDHGTPSSRSSRSGDQGNIVMSRDGRVVSRKD
ncbi:hypothetical protein Tco_0934949, partial [Tanacetum coccineum]